MNLVVDGDRDLIFGIQSPPQHRLRNWNCVLNRLGVEKEMEQSINNSPLICRLLNTSENRTYPVHQTRSTSNPYPMLQMWW